MSKRPAAAAADDRGGDESKQESNKKARVDDQAADAGEKPHCPICDEEWEANESAWAGVASHLPRMLSCFHSFCTSCMAGMNILQQKEG